MPCSLCSIHWMSKRCPCVIWRRGTKAWRRIAFSFGLRFRFFLKGDKANDGFDVERNIIYVSSVHHSPVSWHWKYFCSFFSLCSIITRRCRQISFARAIHISVLFSFVRWFFFFFNFRIWTEMHVFRSHSKRIKIACVGAGPLSRSHTDTVFMVFLFICKRRPRRRRRRNNKKKKMANSQKKRGVSCVSFHRFMCWMRWRWYMTMPLPLFFYLHSFPFATYRAPCAVPFSILTAADATAFSMLTTSTQTMRRWERTVYLRHHPCTLYDSCRYKICNRLQIKSNSSGHEDEQKQKKVITAHMPACHDISVPLTVIYCALTSM